MPHKLMGLSNSRDLGNQQELLASRYLQRQGLVLIYRNYLCNRGEIDLVMTEADQTLVFVEVRFRSQAKFGDAIASITPHKQRRLRLAASHFLISHPRRSHLICRFDVVGISRSPSGNDPQIEWIRNAFM